MSKPFNRAKKKKHEFVRRAGCTDGHHIISSTKGGETLSSNLLQIDVYRHDAWHLLFQHKTIDEIVKFLSQFKNKNEFMHSINDYYKHQAYKLLLGTKTIEEVITFMLRIQSIKIAQAQRVYLLFKSSKMSKLAKVA